MAEEYPQYLFLQEKPTLALLAIHSLEKTYASVITKEINSTFAHTTKILSKMEEYDLVNFTVEGRIKYVELTDQGHDVVERLKGLISSLAIEEPEDQTAHEQGAEDQSDIEEKSEPIKENINRLRLKIERIYKQSLESGADKDAIARKLGPFKREIKRIENMIEESQKPVNEMTLISLEDTRTRLDFIIKKD